MQIDKIAEVCVPIDVAIITIAYPIVVDKISNIGDKYSSQYLNILFNNEFPQKPFLLIKRISVFELVIYSTLLTFLSLIFKAPPPFHWNNCIINNLGNILVVLFTTLLNTFFFIWLKKVALYNGKSTALLKRIISHYNSTSEESPIRQYCLKTINEITIYAVAKQDEHLQETLLEFYSMEFSEIRRKHEKSQPLIYPIDLYFFVSRLIEEIVISGNRKLPQIEHRAVSGIWLLGGGSENNIISNDTYSQIWSNLNLICDNQKFVKVYWATVHQYFDFQLNRIQNKYDENYEVTNAAEVEYRDLERSRFLELHLALGGLLLYRKQSKSLKAIFEYTQSQPPKYVLLPGSMHQIFYWFEHFSNDFRPVERSLNIRYYFPDLDNWINSKQVTNWICKYLALLFIRQYSLDTYYVYQKFTEQPALPDKIIELSNWRDCLPYFEQCLSIVQKEELLINELEWMNLISSHNAEFTNFLTTLKNNIEQKIIEQKLNANLLDDNILKFEAGTNRVIFEAFDSYKNVFQKNNEIEIVGDLELNITGAASLFSKSAFIDDEISNLNYDTVFAEAIAVHRIQRLIPSSFLTATTKRYLLNRGNLENGLEKVIGDNTDVIIIGVNVGYKVREIIYNSKFKDLVRYIINTDYSMEDGLFLLEKQDLPFLNHLGIDRNLIQKFQLKEINSDLKLYCSVIDINNPNNSAIRQEWPNLNEAENHQVQIAIMFTSQILWKKERNVIQINVESPLKEQGVQSEINELKPIKSTKSKNEN